MLNKKIKPRKVLEFSRSAEFYLEMAENAINKNELMMALSSLFRAAKLDKTNPDIKIRLAEVYTMMEQYDISNKLYFEVYAADRTATDVFYGIGQNYYYIGNIDAALYYLNTFAATNLDLEDFDSAEALSLFEKSVAESYTDKDGYRLVYPEKPPTADNTLSIAKNLFRQNKFEEAAELYNSALVIEPENLYIKNSLVMVLIYLKKYKEAQTIAEEVLKQGADDFFALCNLVIIYHYLREEEKKQEHLKRLLACQNESTEYDFKTASVLCEIGEHRAAAEYLYHIHQDRPYDENIIMLIGLAEYNAGNYEASLKYFVKILKLFERDTVAEYYVKYIKGIIDGRIKSPKRVLEYSPMLPPTEAEKRLKVLAAAAVMPTEELNKKWRIGELKPLAEWAIGLGDDRELGVPVVRLISRVTDKDAEKYLQSLLIDTRLGNILRKEIIRIMVEQGVKRISYLYDDIFTTVVPRYPKTLSTMPIAFAEAYAMAFSVLCFVTEGFEYNISQKMNAMIKCANAKDNEPKKLKNAHALAAVLCYKTNAGKLMGKKSFLCSVFEIDIRTFNKYLAALS